MAPVLDSTFILKNNQKSVNLQDRGKSHASNTKPSDYFEETYR